MYHQWTKIQKSESFFVAGLDVAQVKREVLQGTLKLGYGIKAIPGICGGKYGVLFTRTR